MKYLKLILVVLLLTNITLKAQQYQSAVVNLNSSDKTPNSPIWKSGTKQFCDGYGWNIVATITGNQLKIETYPSANNSSYKDKSHPTEVRMAKVINNVIYSSRDGKNFKNEYKYVKNVFYEINNEDQYNPYTECPITQSPKVATLSGSYGNPGGFEFKNGKTTFCLIGQNYIIGVLKRISAKEYNLYFLKPDELPIIRLLIGIHFLKQFLLQNSPY